MPTAIAHTGAERSRLRVLVACSGVGHVARGFERVSQDLARALGSAADVTLVRGGGRWLAGPGLRVPCLQRRGWTARRLRLDAGRAYLVEQRTFAPSVYLLARAGAFDLVHTHDPGVLNVLWHARRRFGGRFAILFANGGGLTPDNLVRPDLVQTVTPDDARRLREAGFPEWRVALVPHGVWPSPPGERTFDDGPPRALIGVGTLNDENKGFATAIRAAALLPEARLRLIGQPDPETSTLAALGATLLGRRFEMATVPPREVSANLEAADVFLLPTKYEGFCLAVLEALGAGLPCVVSDIPVLRWLVGDAAVLVPPGDARAWAAAIASLDPSRRRELSRRALARAAEFAWERLVEPHLEMYRRAIAARARLAAA